MIPFLTPADVKTVMSISLFASGMFTIVFGLIRLLAREFHGAMKSLAAQSVRIGQKAITEDVASIADSAARLMDSVNQLVRTNAGIGAFLTAFGMVQVYSAYWIVTH